MPGDKWDNNKTYLRIVGGKLRESSDEKNPESVRREFTDKKGVTKVYYDIVYKNWSGVIQKLRLRDTNFGEVLDVVFEDAIITLSLNSRFFNDFMQKIPEADLSQKIMIFPYDFEGKGKKRVIGLGLEQASGKLFNHYFDKESKTNTNGFPEPDGDTKSYSKDDWKLYFMNVRKFLKGKIDEVQKQIEDSIETETASAPDPNEPAVLEETEDEDDIKIEDVPV